MTGSPQIRELLDACRPGHDDLAAPEMTPLAAALARDANLRASRDHCAKLDRAIRDAMTDVPVPEGLADRLLARLATQAAPPVPMSLASPPEDLRTASQAAPPDRVDEPSPVISTRTPPVATTSDTTSFLAGRRLRRRALVAACLAASFLLIVGTGWWWMFPASRTPASADELATNGILWSEQAPAAADWNSSSTTAPRDHAVSLQVRGQLSGWRTLSTPYDSRAVAYAVRGPSGDARLFVVHTKTSFLRPNDRPLRLPTTGGVAVAAWTEGPLLYVLVARERHQRIEDFFVPTKLAFLLHRTHVLAA